MADLTLTADAQALVLTIGTESHRLPLADVGHLHRRIDMAVAEARAQHAAEVRAEKHAAELARAKEAHPDGWAVDGGWWGFVTDRGHPKCAPFVGSSADPVIIAAAPSHLRWRNYNGRLLHIGGGSGYRCGEQVDAPTVATEGGKWRVCPRCAVGVARG